MLTEDQIRQVWDGMISAETRALYFGDLAGRHARRKQVITGSTFFLSSGAAATVVAHAPAWVPTLLAVASAGVSAYTMAVGLDRRVGTLVKLHGVWTQIAHDYERLWNHTYADDAQDQLYAILDSERAPSELATTDAPYDVPLLDQWEQRVFQLRHLTDAPA